jgi:UDP-glucuronate 4-epimerase
MDIQYEKVLITGAAGFIGFHLARRLLNEGYQISGIDNMNPYYDIKLKESRLEILKEFEKFSFSAIDMSEKGLVKDVFDNNSFDVVVNLAAQAGVRYSIKNPGAYVDSNLVGFMNILENCRYSNIKHLVFASSSSVYGANTKMPFSVHHNVDHPVSLYAATKKANELMAHTYSHLYDLPCTGLRFFTVYGPWGRPDMALFLFTKAIFEGKPIQVYNHGQMKRDFTYVDDIVEGVVRILGRAPEPNPDWDGNNPDPGTSYKNYRIYNIGNNNPVELTKFIKILENVTGKKANKEYLDLQPGDVVATYADIDDLKEAVGFTPTTPIEKGIEKFVSWYKDYYGYK